VPAPGALPEEAQSSDTPAPVTDAPSSARRGASAAEPAANRGAAVRTPALQAKAATFKGVTPGSTTLEQVREALGKPLGESRRNGEVVLSYLVEPFAGIDVVMKGNVVSSLIIRLAAPTPLASLSKELALDTVEPAPVPDYNGRLLGVVYPERGVLFALVEGSPSNEVDHIVLEPIRAEPFLLRALYDRSRQYEKNLVDLGFAAQLDPADARTYWVRATILTSIGRYSEALPLARKATELEPTAAQYALLRARILGEQGSHEAALRAARKALQLENVPPEVDAAGQCLIGDLMAAGPDRDYAGAMVHHQAAIKRAAPLAADERFAVRRAAKQVLIDAHFGVAGDVAWGRWAKKDDVVPLWLDRAESLVEEFIARDGGHDDLRLLLAWKGMWILSGSDGGVDVTRAAQAAIEEGKKLLAASDDALYQERLNWEMGQMLLDAATIEQTRGKHDKAQELVEKATAFLEKGGARRDNTPDNEYLLARGRFLIGAIHAVRHGDHLEAVEWYEQAAQGLSRFSTRTPSLATARHGDCLVSMGVSYWQTGERERGLELTQQGTYLLEQAVSADILTEPALAIPYGNLASMNKYLGNEQVARELAAKAARLEQASRDVRDVQRR
jgi:tetratricopeptide (TPR) repeat protein